jgi:carboxypeptidase family protein
MRCRIVLLALVLATGSSLSLLGQQPPPPGLLGSQPPARDTPARKDAPPTPTGRIMGRVLAADNGRPVKRARVFITAAELPSGRGMLTDDNGVFDLTELPAGRYTVTVSKSGFVSLSYGQRRPLQAGTPLQLGDGQQLKSVDFRLPRGSVIAGRVLDEDGDAMPGVSVRVMRYQYQQGERRLTPAGTAQTDDRGQYRVWGLMPGDYYVSALARNFNPGAGSRGSGRGSPPPGTVDGGFAGRGGFAGFFAGQNDDPEQRAYAPTYFPGVASVNDAKPIALGLSQEILDVNFNMLLVRAVRITGHVVKPDGTPATRGNVNLVADNTGRGQIGANFGGRIQWDGAFSIANVPPGRYILRSRGDADETAQYAFQPITVNAEDLDGVSVVLAAGATISGTVTFQSTQTIPPDPTQLRITAPSTDQAGLGPQGNARVDKDGHFLLAGVPAGPHLLRSNGNMRGWMLRSVTVSGRDVTDAPIVLRSGETVANVEIVFTDRLTEISGTITNEQGTPVPDYTVLAFTSDRSLWRPLARQIMTARPDQTGKYRIRGLPPGEYYVTTVDPAEQGEWFEPAYLDEHRAGAARVMLGEGDTKTQDFKTSNK